MLGLGEMKRCRGGRQQGLSSAIVADSHAVESHQRASGCGRKLVQHAGAPARCGAGAMGCGGRCGSMFEVVRPAPNAIYHGRKSAADGLEHQQITVQRLFCCQTLRRSSRAESLELEAG